MNNHNSSLSLSLPPPSREFMQRVLFVSELEALHMSSSLSAFQSCSKEGLVKSLWRNHSLEPRVRLVSLHCYVAYADSYAYRNGFL